MDIADSKPRWKSPFESNGALKKVSIKDHAEVLNLEERYAKYKENSFDNDQKNLAQLQTQISVLKRSIDQIKSRDLPSHIDEVSQQIRILENDMDKARLRYDEAVAFHEDLKESIEQSSREWLAYHSTLSRIQNEVHQKREQTVLIAQQTKRASRARDAAQAKLIDMKNKTAEKQDKLMKLSNELDSRLKECRQYTKERQSDLSETRSWPLESDDEQQDLITSSLDGNKNLPSPKPYFEIGHALRIPSTVLGNQMPETQTTELIDGSNKAKITARMNNLPSSASNTNSRDFIEKLQHESQELTDVEEAKFRQIKNEFSKLGPILMETLDRLNLKLNGPIDENHFSEAMRDLENGLSVILKKTHDSDEDAEFCRRNDKNWAMTVAELPSVDLIGDHDIESDDDSVLSFCEPIAISEIAKAI